MLGQIRVHNITHNRLKLNCDKVVIKTNKCAFELWHIMPLTTVAIATVVKGIILNIIGYFLSIGQSHYKKQIDHNRLGSNNNTLSHCPFNLKQEMQQIH